MKIFKKQLLPLLLCVPFCALVIIISILPIYEGEPKVIIRFDDYGVWCNEDWIQIEEDVIKLHEKYNVKLTYAVIPDSKYPLVRHRLSPQSYPEIIDSMNANPYPLKTGSRRVQLLKESTQNGITEVALHGYYHPKGYSNTDKNTEYYNIPYDTQYWKLKRGKHILDSLFNTNVTTLVPPHNTYDNLTLDLLQEFGFRTISAKPNNFDAPLDSRLNIRQIWYTTADFKEFERVLRAKHYTNEPVQVLQLHHTNFTTDGKVDQNKILSYEDLLKFINDNNIPNYTFDSFPDEEMQNNELYFKTLFQNLTCSSHNVLASKVRTACNHISATQLIVFFLISLMLAVCGGGSLLFGPFNCKTKIIHILSIFACVTSGIAIAIMLYCAYNISIYSLHYILLSKKFMLALVVFAAFLPICIKKQESNK